MPMIKDSLEKANLSINNINLIVCDIGPGSFTGIRIGVATAKAFSDSLNIPCIAVNSLESLAYNLKRSLNDGDYICSIIDCKNDNCYYAVYMLEKGNYKEIISPETDSIENLKNLIIDLSNKNITFVGDGVLTYKNKLSSMFTNAMFSEDNFLNSYNLALCGLDKFKNNKFDDVLPLYMKKPQAQIQLEKKNTSIKISEMSLSDLEDIQNNLTTDFDDFWSYETLKQELLSSSSKYIVAKKENQIIGFGGLKIVLDQADIMNIVTKKTSRNEGIASLLLENLISICSTHNLKSITLEVAENNFPAIHLYKKFGFKQISTRTNYYKDKNAIIMQLAGF